MKLTSHLNARADFLFLAPLLNVVLLLLIFFLLNSSLVVQGGVKVELPVSSSSLRQVERAAIISIGAGEEPLLFFNRERITLADLPSKLEKAKSVSRHVIIHADALAAHGMVMKAQEAILAAGCQPAIAAKLKE